MFVVAAEDCCSRVSARMLRVARSDRNQRYPAAISRPFPGCRLAGARVGGSRRYGVIPARGNPPASGAEVMGNPANQTELRKIRLTIGVARRQRFELREMSAAIRTPTSLNRP